MTFDVQDNRTKLFAAAAGIALIAGVGGWWLGSSDGPAPEAEAAAEEEGKAASGPEGFVALTPAAAQAAGIVFAPAGESSLANEILAAASVTAPPEGRSSLTARADGAVTSIRKRLGDPVAAGETVALIESRDAAAIVAERTAAAARATAANAALNRERRLFAEKITARQDLEAAQSEASQANAELRRTQAALTAAGVTADGRHLAVRSLIGGRITKVTAELGAYVSAGAELFEVANARIQVEAAVPAADAARIAPGDAATIELANGSTAAAVVRSSTPALDPESRSATVVLAPAGTPAGLVQGQGVRVRITPRGGSTSGRITVPEESVQSVEGRDVVFARVANGVRALPVTVGARGGGRVEILSGLRAGTVVVTKGAFALKSQLGASEAEH